MFDLVVAYIVVGLFCFWFGSTFEAGKQWSFREFLLSRSCVIWLSIFWLPAVMGIIGFIAWTEWEAPLKSFFNEFKRKIEHDKKKEVQS